MKQATFADSIGESKSISVLMKTFSEVDGLCQKGRWERGIEFYCSLNLTLMC